MLDRVTIAAPCSTDWDSMPGTDRVRHCGQCSKNVYNLSAMTRRQAEALLRETEGRLCTRFYRRADGTILTENCPVGLRAIGRHISRVAGAAMSALATISSATAAQFTVFPVPAELREASSAMNGVVKDERGIGIGNAKVVISRQGSDLRHVITADDSGRFSVESLPWGSYIVRIESSGFSSFTEQMMLWPLQKRRISPTLMVGTVGGPVSEVDYVYIKSEYKTKLEPIK